MYAIRSYYAHGTRIAGEVLGVDHVLGKGLVAGDDGGGLGVALAIGREQADAVAVTAGVGGIDQHLSYNFV